MRNSRHASAGCDGRLARYSSIVKLERQLNVPWRLRAGNLPNRRAKARIRSIVLNVIKGIYEVGPELQPEPFCQREVLMDARIYIGVARRPQTSELRRAVSEARRGLR